MNRRKSRQVLLDTCTFIEYLRKGRADVIQELNVLFDEERAAVSVIAVAELFYSSDLKKREKMKRLLNDIGVKEYPIDKEVSRKFKEIIYANAGRSEGWIPDALIAATAIFHGIELYTLNINDFKHIEGIKLYSPRYSGT